MKTPTIKVIRKLILLLAISALPLSTCKAQTVFEDFVSSDVYSNAIVGSTPFIGGVWAGSDGGQLFDYGISSGNANENTPYSMYTDGAGRSVFGEFTNTLGAGHELIVSFYLIGFGGGWPNSGGYAGVSLYTGNTGGTTGNETQFIGEPYFANQIGLDSTVTGNRDTGNTTVPTVVTYTYAYDTGAWTFTTTSGVNLSGTGVASEPFNALQIHNGAGGDMDLNTLSVEFVTNGAPVITEQPAPTSQTVFVGQSASISVQVAGNAPLTNTWLVESNGVFFPLHNGLDANGSTISGATTTTLTFSNLSLADSTNYAFILSNGLGSQTDSIPATLIVASGPAYFPAGSIIYPTNAQAYSGAPVTYNLTAQGTPPIRYQWLVNGAAVSGATNTTFTLPAPCGTSLIQLAASNTLSTSPALSDVAMLEATNSLPTTTFNSDGTGWTLNGVAVFGGANLALMSDCSGNEASSLFYTNAQYVGDGFTASYVYQATACSGVPPADGITFVLQNSPAGPSALGGSGGQLGYGGINNSIALEFNQYYFNSNTFPTWLTAENQGLTILTDGLTGANGANGNYQPTGNVLFTSGDPISVVVNYSKGTFAVQLEDMTTLATFSTNITTGPITPVLGSSLAYVGFTAGDGGANSTQTISNFSFTPLPVALTIAGGASGTAIVSWPSANTNYTLQTRTSLTGGTWSAGPAATVSGGTSSVTVSTTGGSQYYRLVLTLDCQ